MYKNDTANNGTVAENRTIVHLNCLNFVGRRVLFLEDGAMLSRGGESPSELGVLHMDSVRSLFPISIFADDSEVCGAVFVDAKEGSMLEKGNRTGEMEVSSGNNADLLKEAHMSVLYTMVCAKFANSLRTW